MHLEFNDPDTVESLVVMIDALHRSGELSAHQEMVAERILESAYEQEPSLTPDDLAADINSLLANLQSA